jgi:hypothetical protein
MSNPNLHEILPASAFQVELRDRYNKQIRLVVAAATSSIHIGTAAYEAALRQYPSERIHPAQGDNAHPRACPARQVML